MLVESRLPPAARDPGGYRRDAARAAAEGLGEHAAGRRERFVDELIARVRRAGATGEILLRGDSGFWNKKITAKLRAKGCRYSIGVRLTKPVAAAIEAIPEET